MRPHRGSGGGARASRVEVDPGGDRRGQVEGGGAGDVPERHAALGQDGRGRGDRALQVGRIGPGPRPGHEDAHHQPCGDERAGEHAGQHERDPRAQGHQASRRRRQRVRPSVGGSSCGRVRGTMW